MLATIAKIGELAIAPFVQAANFASEIGIGLNAGHDLNKDNLQFLLLI